MTQLEKPFLAAKSCITNLVQFLPPSKVIISNVHRTEFHVQNIITYEGLAIYAVYSMWIIIYFNPIFFILNLES